MNSKIKLSNVPVSGEFSIDICKGFWTTERVVGGLMNGSLKMDGLGDDSVIRDTNGKIIARTHRANLVVNLENQNLAYEKLDQIPYFFMFSDRDDFANLFKEPSCLDGMEVLLAGKHPEGSHYGEVYAITKKGDQYLCLNENIEFQYKITEDNFFPIAKYDLEGILESPPNYIKEYLHIIQKIITQMP